MKYCRRCNNQLLDEAVVCPRCGCACGAPPVYQAAPQYYQPQYQANPYYQPVIDKESSSTANCALLFAFLMPIVGLICGIVGVSRYKTPSLKSRCVAAIIISLVSWVGAAFFLMMLGF